jgi:hypothetical protein
MRINETKPNPSQPSIKNIISPIKINSNIDATKADKKVINHKEVV